MRKFFQHLAKVKKIFIPLWSFLVLLLGAIYVYFAIKELTGEKKDLDDEELEDDEASSSS